MPVDLRGLLAVVTQHLSHYEVAFMTPIIIIDIGQITYNEEVNEVILHLNSIE